MKDRPPYLELFVDDHLAETAHLNLEQEGAYIRLKCLLWRSPGCRIPNDPEWIRHKLRIDEETYDRVIVPILKEFFKLTKSTVHQPRLLREYSEVQKRRASKSEAGKKGVEAKRLKNLQKTSSNPCDVLEADRKQSLSAAEASLNGCSSPQPQPQPQPQEKSSSSSGAREARSNDPFSEQELELAETVRELAGGNESISRFWKIEIVAAHVRRWLGQGLKPERIAEIVRKLSDQYDEPPSGPKAFDNAMVAAKPKSNGTAKLSTDELFEKTLDRIMAKYRETCRPPAYCEAQHTGELLRRGLIKKPEVSRGGFPT